MSNSRTSSHPLATRTSSNPVATRKSSIPQKRKSADMSDPIETPHITRTTQAAKTHCNELPTSSQFVSAVSKYYDSPKVIVKVEDFEFKLPKDLLCDNSPFFDRAFNGHFQEATELKVTLEETDKTSFEHVIRWMHVGSIAVKSNLPYPYSEEITEYVGFFTLADRLGLPGSFTTDIESVRGILRKDRGSFSGRNVRAASTLPRHHPLRQLFAEACLGDFFGKLRDGGKEFRLQSELNELEGFGTDLLLAFQKAAKGKVRSKTNKHGGKSGSSFPDPVDGGFSNDIII